MRKAIRSDRGGFSATVIKRLGGEQKKVEFCSEEDGISGHIISTEGISEDPSKLEAVLYRPAPKDAKSLHGFLGLTGYYRDLLI